MTITYACEQCSHYDSAGKVCTIGYDASKHQRAIQEYLYNLTGRVAFCRFIEID